MASHIYARVSGKSQDHRSQIPDLKRWEDANGKATWHRDTFTGKTMDRPGFQSMMVRLKAGDTLVIWRLDRLGRTAKGLTALFDELRERKVNLVSIKDSLDLNTPAGRLMANVLASVAAYETEVRAERVRAGQAVARENGKHLGRKPGIHTPIKVNEDHRRLARQMKAEGKPVAVIARTLGLSRPTVYAILSAA
ncbi:MAG: recombinase family protein [Isosphaeraceae bacterium]